MATDVIDLASQILPDWEIDVNLNLPLHMHRCRDCLLFMKHVKENLQGGAMSLYLERQRKHWRHVLRDEIRDELNEAYKDGLKEGEWSEILKHWRRNLDISTNESSQLRMRTMSLVKKWPSCLKLLMTDRREIQ